MDPLNFFSNVVAHIKERPTMLLLGVLLFVIGLLHHFFEFNVVLTAGIAMIGVYGPWVAFDAIKARREKNVTRIRFTAKSYADTMRRAQEALNRSKNR